MSWALQQGFHKENILTEDVKQEWMRWAESNRQTIENKEDVHDTIGVLALDRAGRLAAGTSTSGWKFKWPGRVGDSPLIGSGLYCDGTVGGAVATGDGEEVRTYLSI